MDWSCDFQLLPFTAAVTPELIHRNDSGHRVNLRKGSDDVSMRQHYAPEDYFFNLDFYFNIL